MSRMDQLDALHMTEDDNPVVQTEKGEYYTRYTYKDGSIGWKAHNQYLAQCDQDGCEDIYELGVKSIAVQLKNLRENMQGALIEAQAKGAFQSAVTAYERTQ